MKLRAAARVVAVLWGAALVSGGCGPRVNYCDPGETQDCLCVGGGSGSQTCLSDGLGWTDCDCLQPDATTDAEDDTALDPGPDTTTDTGPDPAVEPGCVTDEDCDNSVYCDGEETCREGECVAGNAVECDDGDDCTMDRCDEDGRECVFEDLDADGDGYVDDACGGGDCDDSRDDVYPGAVDEDCFDGVDQGCDGPDGPTMLEFGIESVWGMAARGVGGGGVWSVLSTEGFQVKSETGHEIGSLGAFPTLAGPVWTGSLFAGLWASDMDGDVHLHRVGTDGVETGFTSSVPVSGDSVAGLAWTGSEFGLFWRGPDPTETYQAIHMLRMDEDGTALGSAVEVTADDASVAEVVWAGDSYFVWLQGRPVFACRADGSLIGSMASTGGHGRCGEALSECMVWTGSELGMIWTEGADDLVFGRYDGDGMAVGSTVTIGNTGSGWPAVATLDWTGSQYATAWWEREASAARILLSLVDGDGTVADADVELISVTETADMAFVELVWVASQWFMVYSHGSGIEDLQCARVGWCQ